MLKFPDVPEISVEDAGKKKFQLSPFFTLEEEEKYLPLMPHCRVELVSHLYRHRL